ncbi:MAG: ATPase with chaperone activity [Burkholderiaceae bacterium]
MSNSDQHFIPSSFTDLFKDPSRPYSKASEPFEVILARYDLCEDMAQMLYQPSLNMMGSMNITDTDVIDRTLQGLLVNPDIVSPREAKWILQRLCELLEWEVADLPALLDALQISFLAKVPIVEEDS